jgi:hypothetical protein
MKSAEVDGVLVQRGDRLFYPGNRMVPVFAGLSGRGSAARCRSSQADPGDRPMLAYFKKCLSRSRFVPTETPFGDLARQIVALRDFLEFIGMA